MVGTAVSDIRKLMENPFNQSNIYFYIFFEIQYSDCPRGKGFLYVGTFEIRKFD